MHQQRETATFIDANTTRQDLLNAVYGDLDAVGFFIDRDIDPEHAPDEVIRENLMAFIEAGDECKACA